MAIWQNASRDLRFVLRGWRRQPGLAATSLLTLALGIGATTTIFSLAEAALLRPLPYPEPERLVRVLGTGPSGALAGSSNVSAQDLLDYARASRSFETLGAFGWTGGGVTLTGGGVTSDAERVTSARVSSGLLRALGTRPALGRFFTAEEDRPGPPAVIVISDGLWRRRFAADPRIAGRAVTVAGMPTVVLGVLPPTFRYPEADTLRASHPPDVLQPIDFDPAASPRSGRYLQAVGRLRHGVAPAAAQAELAAIAARLARLYPHDDFGQGVRLRSLADELLGGARPALRLLLAAAGCLLLIACANIANLLLARGVGRGAEMAVRSALGATPGRLARLLLAESLWLAAAGGLLGVGLAAGSIRLLAAWGSGILPRAASAGLDLPVLLFATAAAGATGVLFGLAPAWQATRQGLAAALAQGGPRTGASRAANAARRALVAAEVALALMLLVGAALLLESYRRLRRVDPGFSPAGVVAAELALPRSRYPEGAAAGFYERLYARAAALPGVEAVGASNILPLDGDYSCDSFQVDERPVPPGEEACAEARSASPGYFRALQIPLLAGRMFDGRDVAAGPQTVLVNQAMARRFWPGEDPIGKTITYLRADGARKRIVGVVGDVRHFGLDREPVPEFYTPQPQPPSFRAMTVVVRGKAAARPAALIAALRREVAAIDPQVPLWRARTLGEMVAADAASPRFRTTILGAFAGTALLLAMIGIHGVLAFAVGQRTREIAIRRALGARDAQLLRLCAAQAMAPALLGIAVGAAAALAAGRLLRGFLFGVGPTDPALFAGCTLLLAAAALAAGYLPGRRATRIEPRAALQAD